MKPLVRQPLRILFWEWQFRVAEVENPDFPVLPCCAKRETEARRKYESAGGQTGNLYLMFFLPFGRKSTSPAPSQ